MRFKRLTQFIAATLILSAYLHIVACAKNNWDRRDKVALLLLVTEDGTFDQPAYSLAINPRFPRGSEFLEFSRHIEKSKGECYEDSESPTEYWCTIPVRGGVCWAEIIRHKVKLDNNMIEKIEVIVGGLGC